MQFQGRTHFFEFCVLHLSKLSVNWFSGVCTSQLTGITLSIEGSMYNMQWVLTSTIAVWLFISNGGL